MAVCHLSRLPPELRSIIYTCLAEQNDRTTLHSLLRTSLQTKFDVLPILHKQPHDIILSEDSVIFNGVTMTQDKLYKYNAPHFLTQRSSADWIIEIHVAPKHRAGISMVRNPNHFADPPNHAMAAKMMLKALAWLVRCFKQKNTHNIRHLTVKLICTCKIAERKNDGLSQEQRCKDHFQPDWQYYVCRLVPHAQTTSLALFSNDHICGWQGQLASPDFPYDPLPGQISRDDLTMDALGEWWIHLWKEGKSWLNSSLELKITVEAAWTALDYKDCNVFENLRLHAWSIIEDLEGRNPQERIGFNILESPERT